MQLVAAGPQQTPSNRRLVVTGLVAVLAIVAAWWAAGLCGELSGVRMQGTTLRVPTDRGPSVLFVGWVTSLAVAVAALDRLRRHMSTALRPWIGAAMLLTLVTTFLSGATSRPPDDERLGSCDISPAGDTAFRFRTCLGAWNPDGFHAIVVRTGGTAFETTYRIEAAQQEDDGGISGAPVLPPTRHGDVIVSKSGIVALYVHGGCAVIWDSREGRTLWNGRKVRGPVGLLALLGPDEEPDPDVVADFVRRTKGVRTSREQGRNDAPPYVAEDELVLALQDSRPSVRSAACSIAEAGGRDLYPRAALLAVLERRR